MFLTSVAELVGHRLAKRHTTVRFGFMSWLVSVDNDDMEDPGTQSEKDDWGYMLVTLRAKTSANGSSFLLPEVTASRWESLASISNHQV